MMKTEQFDKELSDDGNMIDIEDFKKFYEVRLKPELEITNNDEDWNEKLLTRSGKSEKEIRITLLDNFYYANKFRIDSDDFNLPHNSYMKYCISGKKAGYIIEKVPFQRTEVILLGLICGLTREEINHCLKRYLMQSELYSRDIEDFIWIYLIENRGSYEIQRFLSVFYKTRAELNRRLNEDEIDESVAALNTIEMNRMLKTSKAYIEDIFNDEVLNSFRNIRSSMIKQFDNMFKSQSDINVHSFIYHNEGSGAYKKLNNTRNIIKKNRLPAKRHEIIAMCLHLNQDRNHIDKFLSSCGMEKLLPKNIVESIIIFVSNYISGLGNYYSDGYISDDDSENGDYKLHDADIIKSSWMWEYIVESSGENCIDNEELDFNLPNSVIRGIIEKEFLEKGIIDKESDLYRYMFSLYELL